MKSVKSTMTLACIDENARSRAQSLVIVSHYADYLLLITCVGQQVHHGKR